MLIKNITQTFSEIAIPFDEKAVIDPTNPAYPILANGTDPFSVGI